jgi:hypothetical protein
MSDLRERLQELADAAVRQGRLPGPQVALGRARRRRVQRVGGTAVLLVGVLVAVVVGADRLTGPAPLAPSVTTRPSAPTASTDPSDATVLPSPTSPPDVSYPPDPGEVGRPAGSPPGRVGEQMVLDVATVVAECEGGAPGEPITLVAWGKAHRQTWLIAARPPGPGEKWLCWANGLFEGSGAGGIGSDGTMPLTLLRASGSSNIRDGDEYWGQVVGYVTKRAARVRVLFDMGIPPLELEPIQSGDRFPVNFYAGFYRQPAKDKRPATWQVVRVIAYDEAGAKVAECQASGGPGHSC